MSFAARTARLTAVLATLALMTLACGGDESGGGGETSSGADLSGASFTVGSKEFTEQLVMGQITLMALEAAGAEVEDQTGITGTTNVRKALDSDEIDMYWEYTGTGFAEILGNEVGQAPPEEQELYDLVKETDLEQNGVVWTALTAVNNTYAIATSQGASDEFGVATLTDYAGLVGSDPEAAGMCAASEFINRADGLPGLEQAYGFDLPEESITEVELGIIFTRVPEGDPCNFGEVFATDGRIPANDMVVLEDDQDFFVKYNLALTVNQEAYDEYAEEIDAIFTPIAEALDTETLQELNSQVDVDGLLPEEVAQVWLEENGFIG